MLYLIKEPRYAPLFRKWGFGQIFFKEKAFKMLEKVKEIVADELHITVDEIADDADIIEDLGADSLAVVSILMNIEDELGISIPDEVSVELRTCELMAEYLKENG